MAYSLVAMVCNGVNHWPKSYPVGRGLTPLPPISERIYSLSLVE